MHRLLAMAVALALLPAGVAQAQDNQKRPAPDFLFHRPQGSIGVRGSWTFARAGSDLFDFVAKQLTLDKQDFNMPAVGIDLSIALSPRLDIAGGFEFGRMSRTSEYRDFVDNKLLPINQDTRLMERNLTVALRYALAPRATEVSRLAWVPRTIVPYVGAGGGAFWYKFEQQGDFVDFQDLSVFNDYFSSEGWTPSAHVFGGADVRLYRQLFLTVEGRYVWARGKLGRDFIDFDPIDLAGFRVATGLNVVF
jgi:hypothetical protein